MLNIYVQEEMPAYEIIRVAGDGLCILWAFKEYTEVATGKEVAMDDIKEKLRKEMSDTFYQTFPLSAKLCVQDEVERFLTHPLGSYDRETCDMFLAALGNVYKVNIKIYQSNLKKCWVTHLSDEQTKEKDMKEHYILQDVCLLMLIPSYQKGLQPIHQRRWN